MRHTALLFFVGPAAELKERGLPVSGRKAELVARLEEGE